MHRLSFPKRKGFTLIELLLVVSVIALLVSVVLVNLRGAREEADRSRRMRDAATSNRLLVCGQGQMMDLDGNLYRTVEIGGICWMGENLKYLPSVSPSTAVSTVHPTYHVWGYMGTSVTDAKTHPNFLTYGVLYNWQAARTACPPGTRLPTDEEFHILERTFATGACNPARQTWGCHPAGTALKVASPAWDGNNSSGFAALPAGFRGDVGGTFLGLNTIATFWSSTGMSVIGAWRRRLDSGVSTVLRNAVHKGNGFSVRCVR